MSQLTVKDLAKKYGVAARDIVRELNEQGIETGDAVDAVIPEDMQELVESYFADLYDHDEIQLRNSDKRSGKNQSKNPGKGKEKNVPVKNQRSNSSESSGDSSLEGKVITLPSPVIVKVLAEAVGKKPNELISDLIKLGELAGINQPITDANAKKLCASYGCELVFGAAPKTETAPPAPRKNEVVYDPSQLLHLSR